MAAIAKKPNQEPIYGLAPVVIKKADNTAINKQTDAATAAMNNKLIATEPTLENNGVIGVASNIGNKLASRVVRGAGNVQEAASIPLSNAMEGTGKLLFGKNNKPAFGMNDEFDATAPAIVSPEAQAKINLAQKTAIATNPAVTTQVQPQIGTQKGIVANAFNPKQTAQNAITPNLSTTIASPTTTPTTDAAQPMVGVDLTGRGIVKGVGKNGEAMYSSNGTGVTPSLGVQSQKRLTEEQVRQLYRELPADSFSAAGMGGTTAAQRYETQQQPQNRLNIAQPVDPNAQRNALIAQTKQSGNVGDRAVREAAMAQLQALDANARAERSASQQDFANNLAQSKLGLEEKQMEQNRQAGIASAAQAQKNWEAENNDKNLVYTAGSSKFNAETGQMETTPAQIFNKKTGEYKQIKQDMGNVEGEVNDKLGKLISVGYSEEEANKILAKDHPEYFKNKGVK